MNAMSPWANLPLIDSHVHLTGHRGIAPLFELCRMTGIGRLNIVCVPGTPERSLACNAAGLLAKAMSPGTVTIFGGLHYRAGQETTAAALRRQAESLWAAGCDGMKMLEGKPTSRKRIPFRMDDPVYDPYYSFLEEARIPLVWHVADPDSFWDPARISPSAREQGWDYTDGTFPSREQLYGEVDRVLEKHPRLRAIFGHFYFLSTEPERAERFLDRWPGVSFDITPGSEMYRNFSRNPPFWREFFVRHQDRIVFGTDNVAPREPWGPARDGMADKVRMMRQFLETEGPFEGFGTATSRQVSGLGLPEPVLARIYAGNFLRIAGNTPRPLDREAARRLVVPTLDFARVTPGQEDLIRELTEIDALLAGL
jgi:predicted TIM-barrel fold metal-dependent hydrolase